MKTYQETIRHLALRAVNHERDGSMHPTCDFDYVAIGFIYGKSPTSVQKHVAEEIKVVWRMVRDKKIP